jgi:MOSC domain-containing protein YiiM
MIEIGPYVFTETDAARTVANSPDIWDLLADGRDATVLDPLRPTVTGVLADDIRPVWAALTAAGPALRAAGQLPATSTGTVVQLNRSRGGVPKLAVNEVAVGYRGIVGDRQAARVHHGRPWQALCLWSTEVIAGLQAAGHPVHHGAAGENVTIGGLEWAEVRAGVRLRFGTVLCEISAFALPCRTNAQWFVDGDFDVMHHRHGPVSRVYATVLEPGIISTGDAAILEP